ncbi:DUF1499 domain-containing protein [Vibrio breoganii]|uniref:DUF1499 domain-containing protein n=1 Tax=Vibrio breoganii TaxID=553239 RepID=UPI00036A350A|nr:DUF1499 domain-containing protein [Vibrio breoganii]MDN3715979.1 DUF1499 domain-containing protein [Vibrio breoganii]OCH77259.1 hypothetical protein A6D95_01105 [Vibrio breoganii]OEF86302.1 hypothetical protein B003_04655 [Vibrio breoganii 1C10]PMG02388.1 hypothetical protein BCV02_12055 [Vibrio breoganii]PMG91029.1 hypothetical protein BCU79_02045 [Vibrio breoganii]
MFKIFTLALVATTLLGCSNGEISMQDRSAQPCGDKPNCVSTQDSREEFTLAPFTLTENASLDDIEKAALSLGRAKTADKEQDYLRIEYTSRVFRFVDDLELRIDGNTLIVRSESRTGHSDFGVNRKRADALREALKQAGLI